MQNDSSKLKINSENEFIEYAKDGGFLQSEHWGKFQKSLGREVIEIGDDGFGALMIFHELPVVGGYFFVPRGPILRITNYELRITNKNQVQKSNTQKGIIEIIRVAKENNAGWVRIEPQGFEDLEAIKSALGGKYKTMKSKKDHEPAQTLMVDLDKTEEEILAEMKPKTRYNIRLADKRGVEIFTSREANHVEKFIELVKNTARRDRIVPHPDEYYRKMIKNISEDCLKLYFAKYEEEIISAIIVSFFGGVATYLHGVSANEHRNVMAPFALQWQAIQDAKRKGCTKYDLGGTRIPSANYSLSTTHYENWQGITRFKMGFCPKCEPVEFPGCWDIVINGRKYYLYRILQELKDIFR